MTTTKEETTENKEQTARINSENTASYTNKILPKEIMGIMEYLSRNSTIIFKSQQRDEPELQEIEKFKVALDVYQRNPQTFLIRFGSYFTEKHLLDFAKFSIADGDEEMLSTVEEFKNKLKTRQRDIKNRRYTALQKLIREGEYFSEQEMMKRQPELYQELVGQYLSTKEKKQRDSYDVRNTTFSGILMHNLEQRQLSEIMEKAENQIKNERVVESLSCSSSDYIEKDVLDDMEKEESDVPLNCRQQWGNFDNEQIACSSTKMQKKDPFVKKEEKTTPVFENIMADERELLRQEFLSQMHEQFLTGQDKDFDYSTVDDNTQFDDLILINQDEEDKYFEESDEDGPEDEKILTVNKIKEDEESEDELDAFMSHLSNHHSLQKYKK